MTRFPTPSVLRSSRCTRVSRLAFRQDESHHPRHHTTRILCRSATRHAAEICASYHLKFYFSVPGRGHWESTPLSDLVYEALCQMWTGQWCWYSRIVNTYIYTLQFVRKDNVPPTRRFPLPPVCALHYYVSSSYPSLPIKSAAIRT